VTTSQIIGRIVGIERNSMHDGPGIRTTVFCKGCPLRCLWCHNPETIEPRRQLRYIAARCTSCGRCSSACPNNSHAIVGGTHTFDRAACTDCGACTEACLTHALQMAGRDVTPQEVMDTVLRDVHYYKASGGGLTLSGGEPMVQPLFAREVLRLAREHSIHTCLDTSGYCDPADLLDLLPLVNLFLYDCKETSNEQHIALTGVGLDRILANLELISRNGGRIILRCPLVPGLNAREEHFAGIAALAAGCRGIEAVHVLPYEPYAEEKSAQVGRPYACGGRPTTPREVSAAWIDSIQKRVNVPVSYA
jgi:pyruvate formate lyase activating enzyme